MKDFGLFARLIKYQSVDLTGSDQKRSNTGITRLRHENLELKLRKVKQ